MSNAQAGTPRATFEDRIVAGALIALILIGGIECLRMIL